MAGSLSKQTEICCDPRVTHAKVNEYVNYCSQGCGKCRYIMQKARCLITQEDGISYGYFWSNPLLDILKDFELTCYCEHFHLVFYSGSRGHRVVIQMDPDNGEVQVSTSTETWKAYLREIARKGWSSFSDIIVCFFDETKNFLGRWLAQAITSKQPNS